LPDDGAVTVEDTAQTGVLCWVGGDEDDAGECDRHPLVSEQRCDAPECGMPNGALGSVAAEQVEERGGPRCGGRVLRGRGSGHRR